MGVEGTRFKALAFTGERGNEFDRRLPPFSSVVRFDISWGADGFVASVKDLSAALMMNVANTDFSRTIASSSWPAAGFFEAGVREALLFGRAVAVFAGFDLDWRSSLVMTTVAEVQVVGDVIAALTASILSFKVFISKMW